MKFNVDRNREKLRNRFEAADVEHDELNVARFEGFEEERTKSPLQLDVQLLCGIPHQLSCENKQLQTIKIINYQRH